MQCEDMKCQGCDTLNVGPNNRLQQPSQSGKEGKHPNKGSASPSEDLGGEVDNEMDINLLSPSNVPVAGSSTILDGYLIFH